MLRSSLCSPPLCFLSFDRFKVDKLRIWSFQCLSFVFRLLVRNSGNACLDRACDRLFAHCADNAVFLFSDSVVHAPFCHKLSSMLMHFRQKSFSFIINKCHRAYHDSNGSVGVSGLSPTVFQLLNPSTCKPSFKLEDCPCWIGLSGDFQHGFT